MQSIIHIREVSFWAAYTAEDSREATNALANHFWAAYTAEDSCAFFSSLYSIFWAAYTAED